MEDDVCGDCESQDNFETCLGIERQFVREADPDAYSESAAQKLFDLSMIITARLEEAGELAAMVGHEEAVEKLQESVTSTLGSIRELLVYFA